MIGHQYLKTWSEKMSTESVKNDIKKYDYISHITYPYSKKILDILFLPRINIEHIVMRDGNEIYRFRGDAPLATFLDLTGIYTIKKKKIIGTRGRGIYKGVPITVSRSNLKKHCNEILVMVKARDIMSMTSLTKFVVDDIKNETGIEGKTDIFGKMEMC